MAKNLAYTDEVDEAWAKQALTLFTFAGSPPGSPNPVVLDIDGHCPRCTHAMEDTVWLVVISGLTAMSRSDKLSALRSLDELGALTDKTLPAEFTVPCRCTEPHPDVLKRPGLTGCGARWVMRCEGLGNG